MNILELIEKKRDGEELSLEETNQVYLIYLLFIHHLRI